MIFIYIWSSAFNEKCTYFGVCGVRGGIGGCSNTGFRLVGSVTIRVLGVCVGFTVFGAVFGRFTDFF